MIKFGLFFHAGSLNHGCEALIRTISHMIKKYIPDSEVNVFCQNIDEDLMYEFQDIDNFYPFNIFEKGVGKYSLRRVLHFVFNTYLKNSKLKDKYNDYYHQIHYKKVKELYEQDVFISVGGDNYCYDISEIVHSIDKYLHKISKPIVLFGCSVGKENLDALKEEDLKSLDLIIARESCTYQNLVDIGADKNLFLCPDPAFTLETECCEFPNEFIPDNTVGINLSDLILTYTKSRNDAVKSYYNICDYIINETDMNIAFIPHVNQANNDDSRILSTFYNKYKDTGRVCLINPKLNVKQIKWYISKCRFFIGARTHSIVAAYSTNVPALALGYNIKAEGIAKDIFGKTDEIVIPIDSIKDECYLVDYFKKLMENESFYREKLKQVMPNYKAEAENAAIILKKFVENMTKD